MKRLTGFLLLACLCFTLLLCSCGSQNTEPAPDGAMTEVTDGEGHVTGYERRYHNDNGDITRLDIYDADQVYQFYVLYTYDDANRLYTETYYRADGIGESQTVYTYDENGKLYEKAYEMPHGEANVERYDASGNVTEKLYYDADGQLSYREVLENDAWVRYDPTEAPTEELPTEA